MAAKAKSLRTHMETMNGPASYADSMKMLHDKTDEAIERLEAEHGSIEVLSISHDSNLVGLYTLASVLITFRVEASK